MSFTPIFTLFLPCDPIERNCLSIISSSFHLNCWKLNLELLHTINRHISVHLLNIYSLIFPYKYFFSYTDTFVFLLINSIKQQAIMTMQNQLSFLSSKKEKASLKVLSCINYLLQTNFLIIKDLVITTARNWLLFTAPTIVCNNQFDDTSPLYY